MLQHHPDQMTDVELDAWVRRLVDTAEPEGIRLDYKQEIKTNSAGEKRELAKDITSFANEIGGTLIYGVPEDRTNPEAAPIPKHPYGIDSIPGLQQDLENIFSSVITPLLPEYRIKAIPLSEYPDKFCYIVWTPESWASPHMVHGYGDDRYYRRGQFRSIIMSERDVEERYRRRITMGNAAEEYMISEDAQHLRQSYQRNLARTTFMIVPLLLMSNRVLFQEPDVRQWLNQNWFLSQWMPSMRGVRTSDVFGTGDKGDLELQRNGAMVGCYYTKMVSNVSPPSSVIYYLRELQEMERRLEFASKFYHFLGYTGPLIVSLTIHCLAGRMLELPRHGTERISLGPNGTDVKIRFDFGASELISDPNSILRRVGDELFRAFGLWEADCFDGNNRIVG